MPLCKRSFRQPEPIQLLASTRRLPREAESQIPAGTGRPELAPATTGLGEVYQYLVRAEPGCERQYNARELRSIQDWIVRRQLLGTPGVADVSSFGGLLKQYEVGEHQKVWGNSKR